MLRVVALTGGSRTSGPSSRRSTRPVASAAAARPAAPPPITSVSTCRWRCRDGRGATGSREHADTGPRGHDQTVNYLDHRCGADRLEPRGRDLHERVRFLDARRVHATWPPLDRGDEPGGLPAGEQRARDRVAREHWTSRPSDTKLMGLDRSIQAPPMSSRRPVTPGAPRPSGRCRPSGGRRVADRVEPPAAARRVHPPLRPRALRVVPMNRKSAHSSSVSASGSAGYARCACPP